MRSAAVRERCALVLRLGRDGRSPHFTLDARSLAGRRRLRRRGDARELSRSAHSLSQPLAAFFAPAASTAGQGSRSASPATTRSSARASAVDLATVSVLLDAGAGDAWRYREAATGLHLRALGGARGRQPRHVCAPADFPAMPTSRCGSTVAAWISLSARRWRATFRSTPDNPLVGLRARAALLRRLGARARSDGRTCSAARPRGPGNIVDHLLGRRRRERRGAGACSTLLLDGVVADLAVRTGDRRRPARRCRPPSGGRCADDATDGIVPFHKLSQWLTYSLIEPLEDGRARGGRSRRAHRARRNIATAACWSISA